MTETQTLQPADLIEAVAALQVNASSTILHSCSDESALNSRGLDSGYASPSSTPDSKVAFTFKPLVRHRFRKPKQLKPYKKLVPESTHERFSDLRQLYAESLNQFTKGLPESQGILMSLVVLGEDETSAEPWVLVQCDKAIFKMVNNFFKQSFIKKEFEPQEPTTLPYPSTACDPEHPEEVIQIFSCGEEIISGTLCGTQIITQPSKGLHKATIGGIVAVVDKNGETTLLGLSAGHFLAPKPYREESDEVAEYDTDDEEDTFELDLNSFNAVVEDGSFAGFDELEDKAVLCQNVSHLGNILTTSHVSSEDGQNFDWALITIDDPSFRLPNMITFYYQQRELKLFPRRGRTEFDRRVVVISAHGPLFGTLSTNSSYMMLARGSILVPTHLLSLANINGNTLRSGDSGAWVINDITNEVYGHVVADDVFGRGYVVPIHDSLEDIKNQLDADAVFLPCRTDFNPSKATVSAIPPAARPIGGSTLEVTKDPDPILAEWFQDMQRGSSTHSAREEVDNNVPSQVNVTAWSASQEWHSSSFQTPDSGYTSMRTSPGQSPQETPVPRKFSISSITTSSTPLMDSVLFPGACASPPDALRNHAVYDTDPSNAHQQKRDASDKGQTLSRTVSQLLPRGWSSDPPTRLRRPLRGYLAESRLVRRLLRHPERKRSPSSVFMEEEEDEAWA